MAQFELVSPNLWKIDGRTITIDGYIEDRRRDVNATEICVLQAFPNRLLDKLKEVNRSEYPELSETVHLLVRILESTGAHHTEDPLPNWLAEVGFVALRVRREQSNVVQDFGELSRADILAPEAGAPPAWFHCLRSVACRRSNQNRPVRVELKLATFSV